jgi:hypothetical protein
LPAPLLVHELEAVGGNADSGCGAGKGDAVFARRAAVDEEVDIGENAGGFVEESGGLHGVQAVDEGAHLTEEVLFFLERSAAVWMWAMGGAELLAAFGNAAAFAAVGKDVDAFFDHDGFLRAMKKARRGEPSLS